MYIVNMNQTRFAWDQRKNKENRSKHGVSFEEAQTVFLDENAIRFFDPDHSEEEDRLLLVTSDRELKNGAQSSNLEVIDPEEQEGSAATESEDQERHTQPEE